MGIINRAYNWFRGKSLKAINAVSDPIEQYDLKIADKRKALKAAKLQSSDFFGQINTKKEEIEKMKKDIEEHLKAIKIKGAEDPEKAKEIMEEMDDIQDSLDSAEASLARMNSRRETVLGNIKAFEKEIRDLVTLRNEKAEEFNTSKTVLAIKDALGTPDEVDLNAADDKIRQTKERAEGIVELDNELDKHDSVAEIVKKANRGNADERLKAILAEK